MTQPKTPPKVSTQGRSGGKARVVYTEADKAKALAMLEAGGMAATHRATGIPKSTLNRWAKAAGVDLGDQARTRTKVATEAVRARAAEVKLNTVELLEGHLAQAGHFLATIAGINAQAADAIADLDPDLIAYVSTMAGPKAVINDANTSSLVKRADALALLPLAVRDAEGIVTRAIHDLQLLRGEATERGDLRVEFAIPRPVAPSGPIPVHDTQEN